MDGEIKIDVVQKLLNKQSSRKIMTSSFKIFKCTKENLVKQIMLYIIAIIPSVLMGMSSDTLNILVETIRTILDIILALFGIVFTGYSFFQALINQELLIRMIQNTVYDNSDGKQKSKLQETNESFVECMMLNLVSIFLSLVLMMCINCIPEDYLLFEKLIYNNIVSAFLISIYFYFIFTIIWEVKSFVFNVFQLFNAYAGTRVIELFKNKNN